MTRQKYVEDKTVWNGTFAHCFVNGRELLTLQKIETRDEIEYENIAQPGRLRDGRKMKGVKGKGEFTILTVDKILARELSQQLDRGEQPEVEIQATNDDPASNDAAYMAFYGCSIDAIDYIVGGAHEVVEEKYSFEYSGREWLN